jgi:YD repeat-containing protein
MNASAPVSTLASYTYTLGAAGKRTAVIELSGRTVPSQTSTYDVNDRLATENYDNNGNTTAANGMGYAYDFENHLTSLNGGNLSHEYDGHGNRVAKTVGGVTTHYLVNTNNPTGSAQVLRNYRTVT